MPHQLIFACDLLQTLVFTIAILQSARYSPSDQRVFYWVARVEYTSVAILAIWDLLYIWLRLPYNVYFDWPLCEGRSGLNAISVSISMVHVVSACILLATSIRLKIKSNPVREKSKARTICFEHCISAGCERSL